MMRDLQSTQAMWLKGVLFLFIGLISGALLIFESWDGRTAVLLALCVWGFCRAYYFFYVIKRWVDPGFKFSGLGHFVVYLWRRCRK